jgi:hypothetical protein
VVSTAATAPKVAALSARPDVALTIDSGDTPGEARALSIRGRASVRIVDGVTEEYLASARKAMDAEAVAQFEQSCLELYDQMARIGSRRTGCATTTSAPADFRDSCRSWSHGPDRTACRWYQAPAGD